MSNGWKAGLRLFRGRNCSVTWCAWSLRGSVHTSPPRTASPAVAGAETLVAAVDLVFAMSCRHQTKHSGYMILFVPYSNPIRALLLPHFIGEQSGAAQGE